MVDDAVDPAKLKAFRVSEADFQNQILYLAKVLGWDWYHTYDSRKSVKGFPDLVLVREVILYLELKKEGEKLTSEQRHWATIIPAAGGNYMAAWPSHFSDIAELLGDPVKKIASWDADATSATMATEDQEGGQNGKGSV